MQSNFVEEYIKWSEEFTDAPGHFHRYSAYWLLSTILGRKVWIRFGRSNLYTNIWMIIIAPSSLYRKSTVLGTAKHFINDLKPEILLPDQWSQESLIASIKDQPHCAVFSQEFSGFLELMGRSYNLGSQSFITDMYDCPNYFRRKIGTNPPVECVIEKAYMTILGASTLDWLLGSITNSHIAGGFLARFLLCSAFTKDKSYDFPKNSDDFKEEIIKSDLRRLSLVEGEAIYDKDALEYYKTWYRNFERKIAKVDSILIGFLTRIVSYFHKFSVLEAVLSGDFPTITINSCMRAEMSIDYFVSEIFEIGNTSLGKSESHKKLNRIVAKVKNSPGIKRRDLLRYSHLTIRDFDDIVRTAVESGLVENVNSGFFAIMNENST